MDRSIRSNQKGSGVFFGPPINALASVSLRHQHGGAVNAAVPQAPERFIGLGKLESLHLRANWNLRREAEKLFPISARQIGDGANRALSPKDGVSKTWDVAHVDAGANNRTAL
jgi:hypothetical protein